MKLETWVVTCENKQGKEQVYTMLIEPGLSIEQKRHHFEQKAMETDHPRFIKAEYGYASIHNIGESKAGEGFYYLD